MWSIPGTLPEHQHVLDTSAAAYFSKVSDPQADKAWLGAAVSNSMLRLRPLRGDLCCPCLGLLRPKSGSSKQGRAGLELVWILQAVQPMCHHV